MTTVFLKLLNMSITAGWIVLALLCLRPVFKKAPKSMLCGLWMLVAIRLICPFAVESSFSLIPSVETVPEQIVYQVRPAIESGLEAVNAVVNPALSASFSPNPGDSANPLQIWIPLAAVLWIAGVVMMFGWGMFSYVKLRRRVHAAVRLKYLMKNAVNREEGELEFGTQVVGVWKERSLPADIWLCDEVKTPFILGIFRPRIYLPSNLQEDGAEYIIAHEKAHLRRRDHLWKPLGFLLLALYWFHPLMWVAYYLLCRDIESACDEKVIREMEDGDRKSYAETLLFCSVERHLLNVCPLAFGEIGVKDRVKRIVNYKKPGFWVMVAAVVICVVASVCFLTNPVAVEVEDNTAQLEDVPQINLSKLQSAISEAVMQENYSSHSEQYFCCESHVILHTEENAAVQAGELKEEYTVTAYVMALYQEYAVDDKGIREECGSHMPLALTFSLKENGDYDLEEYWQPKDGSYYTEDIKEKFPSQIVKNALNTQKYILANKQACYNQVVEAAGDKMAVSQVIERLIETIESSPKEYSSVKDYLEAHPLEYRELLYYGDNTSRYCMTHLGEELEKSEGALSLRTHLLLRLIEDISEEERLFQRYEVALGNWVRTPEVFQN